MIQINEEVLKEIVTRVVKQVLSESSDLITEMAVERKTYIQHGLSQSATVLKHIGKICMYEDNAIMSRWVRHWKDEIAAQVFDMGKVDITKDTSGKVKQKAFVKSFIEGRLGENFSEYDAKMPLYIEDALEEEGMTKDEIRKIDIDSVAAANKERIRRYLYSFVNLLTIKDGRKLKDEVSKAAHNF